MPGSQPFQQHSSVRSIVTAIYLILILGKKQSSYFFLSVQASKDPLPEACGIR